MRFALMIHEIHAKYTKGKSLSFSLSISISISIFETIINEYAVCRVCAVSSKLQSIESTFCGFFAFTCECRLSNVNAKETAARSQIQRRSSVLEAYDDRPSDRPTDEGTKNYIRNEEEEVEERANERTIKKKLKIL